MNAEKISLDYLEHILLTTGEEGQDLYHTFSNTASLYTSTTTAIVNEQHLLSMARRNNDSEALELYQYNLAEFKTEEQKVVHQLEQLAKTINLHLKKNKTNYALPEETSELESLAKELTMQTFERRKR